MAIKKCTCVNEYQDKRYGKNMRVMNPLHKGKTGDGKHRCTTCGVEK